jgi:RNA polymerase sigma-70 factor (ECF subfamily)
MKDNNGLEFKQIEDSKRDPRCFEPIYNQYFEQILKFIYKRMESFDDTKEVTARVFSKALNNIKKYSHQGFPFSSWLYRIAINEITEFYRDKTKRRAINLNEKGVKNLSEETGTQKNEQINALKKALQYLNEEDLILIELRFFEERSFSEVGSILNITENNAKVKTYRVIDKLKEIYSKLS